MSLGKKTAEGRTLITAGDRNYVWGFFILVASMRRWRMKEKILIGAYSWPREWLDFMAAWSNVRIVELSASDRCCVTVTKPLLMLKAGTDYVTWGDSDGMFTGNCSDFLYGEDERIYIREYNAQELASHTFSRLPNTISTWISDVGELPARRDISDACANVVGLSIKRNRAFVEKWIFQMEKVLPIDAGVVSTANSPYFQTDESVMNLLLSCWGPAPEITRCYRLNNKKTVFHANFAYNPKTWQKLWTPFSLRYYDRLLSLMEWCASEGLLPDFEPLPKTLLRRNERFYRFCAPGTALYFSIKKRIRKMGVLR